MLFVLFLLVLPWFRLPDVRLNGREQPAPLEPLSLSALWKGKFQKAFDAWWTLHFGSRGTLMVFKNTVYDVLNCGLFHSGYRKSVLQGRNGVLFEEGYLRQIFLPVDTPNIHKIIEDNVAALTTLRDALAHLDVPLVLILAPNKAAFRQPDLPPVWRFLAEHRKLRDLFALYDLYARACDAHGLLCVNSPRLLQQAGGQHYAFPDQGTHWSMYAAALAWQQATRLLHAREPGRFPIVKLKDPALTNASHFSERDIADVLNVFPPYAQGRPERAVAQYVGSPHLLNLSGLSLGDSFSKQISFNIRQSLFSKLFAEENWKPDAKLFIRHIRAADYFVLTYTELNLYRPRIRNDIKRYMQLLSGVLPVCWHDFEPSTQGQWSQATSFLHFFNIYDGDLQLTMTIKSALSTVTSCDISVNGNKLTTLDIRGAALPRKAAFVIPTGHLRKGENIITLDVKGAAVPFSMWPENPDVRQLGIFCSDFAITQRTHAANGPE